MLFNSAIFLVFALIFFVILYFVHKSGHIKLRWFVLVAASFFFYGWWDWRFLFLIIGSGFIDYFSAHGIVKYPHRKKLFLVLSILGNLGSLAIFKYSGFIASNIDALTGLVGLETHLYENVPKFMLLLPVGISFYTFQSMSYTIDIYKGKLKPTNSILHFFAYLALFPQLVAGPIVRARDLIPQLTRIRLTTELERWNGIKLIAIGFFKKVVLADNIGPMVNMAFSNVHQTESTSFWWLVMIGFGFQIYFDFSGYSDIARGLAKWMGLHFRINFNHPYHSASLREFWTRWHISLSTWFRDYVYIPLGGSRKGLFNAQLFMWITMVVSGLWHGASWNFVIWGAIHALFLSFERLSKWPKYLKKNVPSRILSIIIINVVVVIAWIFFRADNLDTALYVLGKMFSPGATTDFLWNDTIKLGAIMVAVSLLIEIVLKIKSNPLYYLKGRKRIIADLVYVTALIVLAIFFRGEGNEFIYFQF